MTLIDRFRYIMKLNQLSASAFADEIGVQRSSVSHVLSGRNKPSLEFIQKILTSYPKVDANWLINGTTSIQKEEIESPKSEEHTPIQEEERQGPTVPLSNPEVQSETTKSASIATKRISKILIFYSDQSFEEYLPAN